MTKRWKDLAKDLETALRSWDTYAVDVGDEVAMRHCLELFGDLLMDSVRFCEFNFTDDDEVIISAAIDALFKYTHIQNARKLQHHSIKTADGDVKSVEGRLGTGMFDSQGNEMFEGNYVRGAEGEVLKVVFRKGAFFLGDLLLMDYIPEHITIIPDNPLLTSTSSEKW